MLVLLLQVPSTRLLPMLVPLLQVPRWGQLLLLLAPDAQRRRRRRLLSGPMLRPLWPTMLCLLLPSRPDFLKEETQSRPGP
jgi:hypothetical protein